MDSCCFSGSPLAWLLMHILGSTLDRKFSMVLGLLSSYDPVSSWLSNCCQVPIGKEGFEFSIL